MPLVKRLRRICKLCKEKYVPDCKYSKYCKRCRVHKQQIARKHNLHKTIPRVYVKERDYHYLKGLLRL
jgi:hypothetical protein